MKASSMVMKLKGLVSVIACALLVCACALAGCTDGAQSPGVQMPQTKAALDYLRGQDLSAGPGAEWQSLALARAGDDAGASPLADFAAAEKSHVATMGGIMDERYSTEYSKAILALTAVGVDARAADGHDLFTGLTDMAFIEKQGLNGPVWALIALDCNPAYDLPDAYQAERPASREAFVKAILKAQNRDGGWALDAADDESFADMTAMALTALAPHRGDDARVDEACEKGVSWLSGAQGQSGGFAYRGQESSESSAQVVVALAALGIDPETDERFVKDGASVLGNLLGYQDDTGGFSHVAGEAPNTMSSEQGAYALVALERLRAGNSPLFDMSDVDIN